MLNPSFVSMNPEVQSLFPVSNQKKLVEESIFIAAPVDIVWQAIAEPDNIPLWNKDILEVQLVESYSKSNGYVGTFRDVFRADGNVQRQIITAWNPEKSLEYRTIAGLDAEGYGLDLHMSMIRLNACIDGTDVHWINYVEYREGKNNSALNALHFKHYRHNLIYLKNSIESVNPELRGGVFTH